MSDPAIRVLSAVIGALAHTWDSKLPGYRTELIKQLEYAYMQTPATDLEVRNALDEMVRRLENGAVH